MFIHSLFSWLFSLRLALNIIIIQYLLLYTQSVTLTNYVGLERDLVRDMIRIIGIPYTGHLSRTTTHLICKRLVMLNMYVRALLYTITIVWKLKLQWEVLISTICYCICTRDLIFKKGYFTCKLIILIKCLTLIAHHSTILHRRSM